MAEADAALLGFELRRFASDAAGRKQRLLLLRGGPQRRRRCRARRGDARERCRGGAGEGVAHLCKGARR